MSNADLTFLSLGIHGAAGGLFLLLALLMWRDRGRGAARGLSAVFALGAAAQAVVSAPGFQAGSAAWQAPILALSWGATGLFWVWARSAFDDDFTPRRWHAAPWAVLALGGLLVTYLRVLWPVASGVAADGLSLLALGLACLAVVQSLTTWRADLVAGRRRLRWGVLIGVLAYIVVSVLADFAPPRGFIHTPSVNLGEAAGLFALAMLVNWGLLRTVRTTPAAALPPVGVGLRDPAPPDAANGDGPDSVLLRRLEHLMAAERVHRQEGLTIGILAARLRLPEYRLRQAINEGLGYRNFNVFLNHYRIEEAKAALADPAQKDVPVLTIAMDSGFQSIGPFNRSFKTDTGMTPTDYRRSALAQARAMSLNPQADWEIGKAV